MTKAPEVLYTITWRSNAVPDETRHAHATEDAMHDVVAALRNAGVLDVEVHLKAHQKESRETILERELPLQGKIPEDMIPFATGRGPMSARVARLLREAKY